MGVEVLTVQKVDTCPYCQGTHPHVGPISCPSLVIGKGFDWSRIPVHHRPTAERMTQANAAGLSLDEFDAIVREDGHTCILGPTCYDERTGADCEHQSCQAVYHDRCIQCFVEAMNEVEPEWHCGACNKWHRGTCPLDGYSDYNESR